MDGIYYLAPMVGGCAIALLPAINNYVSEVTKSIGFIILANFTLGTVVLSAIYAIGYPVELSVIWQLPTWLLLGGVYGTVTVVVMTITPAQLGIGKSLSAFIFARLISATVIDHFGWLSMTKETFTLAKCLGVCLALVGALFVLRVAAHSTHQRNSHHFYILLCLLSGCCSSMQSSTNAALFNEVDSFIFVTWLNFIQNALCFIVVYFAIFSGKILYNQSSKIYLLGILSALTSIVVIAMMALGSGMVGVAVTVVFSIVTQLTTAMIIDHCGWFRVARHTFTYKSISGLACLTVGAYLLV